MQRSKGLTEPLDHVPELLVIAVSLDELTDRMEERPQHPPGAHRQLAADQIQSLHAVGALVDHRNPRIADKLFHAVVADVAVTAVDLHADIGRLEPEIGEQRFHDRRHQRGEILGALAGCRDRSDRSISSSSRATQPPKARQPSV